MANTSESKAASYRQTKAMLERRQELREYLHTYNRAHQKTEIQRDPQTGAWSRVPVGQHNPLMQAIALQKLSATLKEQAADFFKLHQQRGELGTIYATVHETSCVFISEDDNVYHRLLPRVKSSFPINCYKSEYHLPGGIWLGGIKIGPIQDAGLQDKYVEWLFLRKSSYERLMGDREEHPFFNLGAFQEIPEDFHFGCNKFE